MSQAESSSSSQNEGQYTSGKLLQMTRQAQQLSHSDVANKLRISEQYVKDLEGDDFSHIGARIYVRGYLLSYAKLLGINQNEMMQAMQVSFLPEEGMSMQRMMEREKPTINISLRPRGHYKRHFSRWMGVVIAILLVALVTVWWQNQKRHIYSNSEIDNVNHLSAADKSAPSSDNKAGNEQNLPLAPIVSAPLKQTDQPAAAVPQSNLQTNAPLNSSLTTPTTTVVQPGQQPISAENAVDGTDQPQTLPSNSTVSNNIPVGQQPANLQTPTTSATNTSVNTSGINPQNTTTQNTNTSMNTQTPTTTGSSATTTRSSASTRYPSTRHVYRHHRVYHAPLHSLPAPGAT